MRLRHGCSRFGVLVVLVAVGVLGFSANAFAETTLFSSTTPGMYSVTVPLGVTGVTITAVGGSGGASVNEGLSGGQGGIITSTATVAPGDSLSITVGENGACGGTGMAPCTGTGGSGAGNGGSSREGYGGGGGGGSAVSDGAATLVVGGGGGGSAQGQGGNADQNSSGSAGTLSGPGAGQCYLLEECASSGAGMNGGGGGLLDFAGGGGGYFGGGAAIDGGGGGGASYPAPATQWDTTATPSVTITYTAPPVCTAVNGVGHIAPKGKEGQNLRVHLSTSGGTFRTTTPNGAAVFALRTLSSASCAVIPGGVEFSGRGAATMGGPEHTGYEMVFSFATEGAKTYLSLEVMKGATVVYKVTHEPLTKGSKVKIS
jgi:hypothetical protein